MGLRGQRHRSGHMWLLAAVDLASKEGDRVLAERGEREAAVVSNGVCLVRQAGREPAAADVRRRLVPQVAAPSRIRTDSHMRAREMVVRVVVVGLEENKDSYSSNGDSGAAKRTRRGILSA
jgi:hypothetical protein